jgi:hypothetical protein
MVMAQIPALFLPPRGKNGKKTSMKKNTSNVSIGNNGGVHERKEKKNKSTAYLFLPFKQEKGTAGPDRTI